MAGFTSAEAADILNHEFRAATLTKRAGNWVCLFTADPTEAGSFTNEVPIGVNGYARVSVPLADDRWTDPSVPVGGVNVVSNLLPVTFGNPTGTWAGGANITHFGIASASSGGRLVAYGLLGTPRPVLATDTNPTFGTSALVARLA